MALFLFSRQDMVLPYGVPSPLQRNNFPRLLEQGPAYAQTCPLLLLPLRTNYNYQAWLVGILDERMEHAAALGGHSDLR